MGTPIFPTVTIEIPQYVPTREIFYDLLLLSLEFQSLK